MYRKDHTLFQTIVDVGGFEGGVISGPKGKLGTILRVKITGKSLVVVYWRDNPKTATDTLPPLPIFVSIGAIYKVSEEGEGNSFHAKITETNLWVLCLPTQPTEERSLAPHAWGE